MALDAATGTERWARDLDAYYVAGAVAVDEERVFAGTFDAGSWRSTATPEIRRGRRRSATIPRP